MPNSQASSRYSQQHTPPSVNVTPRRTQLFPSTCAANPEGSSVQYANSEGGQMLELDLLPGKNHAVMSINLIKSN